MEGKVGDDKDMVESVDLDGSECRLLDLSSS